MTSEREARGWSKADAVRSLRADAAGEERLPDAPSLLRQWKRWETGDVKPSDFYQAIIARTFGTVTHAIWPVLAAADTGHAIAPHGPAAVQLHAQKAKAWARIGDRRQVEAALDQGRALLEKLLKGEDAGNR